MKNIIILLIMLNATLPAFCLAPNSRIEEVIPAPESLSSSKDRAFPKNLIREPKFEYTLDSGSMDGTLHQIYRDEKGSLWLFKKYPVDYNGEDRTHRAYADQFASQLSKRLHLDTHVAAYTAHVDRGVGALFEFIDGDRQSILKVIGPGMDYNKLSRFQILALVKEQVLDWLISNHDSHTKNFLVRRGNDQEIYAIDKSQAFKYFGKDVLSYRYNPNEPYNGKRNYPYMPVYNTLLPQIAHGTVTKVTLEEAYGAVMQVIKEVESITDREYADMIMNYVNYRFYSKNDKLVFLAMVLKRKNGIRLDFNSLYASLGLSLGVIQPKSSLGKSA